MDPTIYVLRNKENFVDYFASLECVQKSNIKKCHEEYFRKFLRKAFSYTDDRVKERSIISVFVRKHSLREAMLDYLVFGSFSQFSQLYDLSMKVKNTWLDLVKLKQHQRKMKEERKIK